MASNLSKPFSIRLTPDREAELTIIMGETGWNKNKAILHLLGLGVQTYRDTPKFTLKEGPTPEHKSKSGVKTVLQSKPDKPRAPAGKASVAVAPDRKLKWVTAPKRPGLV